MLLATEGDKLLPVNFTLMNLLLLLHFTSDYTCIRYLDVALMRVLSWIDASPSETKLESKPVDLHHMSPC